ncbi:MAG TPA: response regulator [Candidatus Acidoferrales bacterium]|jgi:signal transduction histidine kinase|nr:response regulator [Candidatus Acidoferrales bacterium]
MAKTFGKPLTALVIEDDLPDFEILAHTLSSAGFRPDCRRVDTEADFVAQLKPGIDVVLSDYNLPGWNALRALELFRASRLDVPFIVVSGAISEEVAVECMKHGASDYLLKDRLGRLGPAIVRAIEDLAERRLVEGLSTRLLQAQEEERKSIARELHDHIGQGMAVLLIELHNLEAKLPPEDSAQALLKRIVELVRGHEAVVRDMGLLLRPYMLDDLGLVPALKWQAREVSRRTGMTVTVDADEEFNLLSDDYRTCIYRVVQETLHNAARHARATHAHVTLRQDPGRVRLEIQDDGRGFDTRYKKGMGMLGIQERARHLGGLCLFDSEPGRGARVLILLPRPLALDQKDLHETTFAATGQ